VLTMETLSNRAQLRLLHGSTSPSMFLQRALITCHSLGGQNSTGPKNQVSCSFADKNYYERPSSNPGACHVQVFTVGWNCQNISFDLGLKLTVQL
jgi:hypothetical protein